MAMRVQTVVMADLPAAEQQTLFQFLAANEVEFKSEGDAYVACVNVYTDTNYFDEKVEIEHPSSQSIMRKPCAAKCSMEIARLKEKYPNFTGLLKPAKDELKETNSLILEKIVSEIYDLQWIRDETKAKVERTGGDLFEFGEPFYKFAHQFFIKRHGLTKVMNQIAWNLLYTVDKREENSVMLHTFALFLQDIYTQNDLLIYCFARTLFKRDKSIKSASLSLAQCQQKFQEIFAQERMFQSKAGDEAESRENSFCSHQRVSTFASVKKVTKMIEAMLESGVTVDVWTFLALAVQRFHDFHTPSTLHDYDSIEGSKSMVESSIQNVLPGRDANEPQISSATSIATQISHAPASAFSRRRKICDRKSVSVPAAKRSKCSGSAMQSSRSSSHPSKTNASYDMEHTDAEDSRNLLFGSVHPKATEPNVFCAIHQSNKPDYKLSYHPHQDTPKWETSFHSDPSIFAACTAHVPAGELGLLGQRAMAQTSQDLCLTDHSILAKSTESTGCDLSFGATEGLLPARETCEDVDHGFLATDSSLPIDGAHLAKDDERLIFDHPILPREETCLSVTKGEFPARTEQSLLSDSDICPQCIAPGGGRPVGKVASERRCSGDQLILQSLGVSCLAAEEEAVTTGGESALFGGQGVHPRGQGRSSVDDELPQPMKGEPSSVLDQQLRPRVDDPSSLMELNAGQGTLRMQGDTNTPCVQDLAQVVISTNDPDALPTRPSGSLLENQGVERMAREVSSVANRDELATGIAHPANSDLISAIDQSDSPRSLLCDRDSSLSGRTTDVATGAPFILGDPVVLPTGGAQSSAADGGGSLTMWGPMLLGDQDVLSTSGDLSFAATAGLARSSELILAPDQPLPPGDIIVSEGVCPPTIGKVDIDSDLEAADAALRAPQSAQPLSGEKSMLAAPGSSPLTRGPSLRVETPDHADALCAGAGRDFGSSRNSRTGFLAGPCVTSRSGPRRDTSQLTSASDGATAQTRRNPLRASIDQGLARSRSAPLPGNELRPAPTTWVAMRSVGGPATSSPSGSICLPIKESSPPQRSRQIWDFRRNMTSAHENLARDGAPCSLPRREPSWLAVRTLPAVGSGHRVLYAIDVPRLRAEPSSFSEESSCQARSHGMLTDHSSLLAGYVPTLSTEQDVSSTSGEFGSLGNQFGHPARSGNSSLIGQGVLPDSGERDLLLLQNAPRLHCEPTTVTDHLTSVERADWSSPSSNDHCVLTDRSERSTIPDPGVDVPDPEPCRDVPYRTVPQNVPGVRAFDDSGPRTVPQVGNERTEFSTRTVLSTSRRSSAVTERSNLLVHEHNFESSRVLQELAAMRKSSRSSARVSGPRISNTTPRTNSTPPLAGGIRMRKSTTAESASASASRISASKLVSAATMGSVGSTPVPKKTMPFSVLPSKLVSAATMGSVGSTPVPKTPIRFSVAPSKLVSADTMGSVGSTPVPKTPIRFSVAPRKSAVGSPLTKPLNTSNPSKADAPGSKLRRASSIPRATLTNDVPNSSAQTAKSSNRLTKEEVAGRFLEERAYHPISASSPTVRTSSPSPGPHGNASRAKIHGHSYGPSRTSLQNPRSSGHGKP